MKKVERFLFTQDIPGEISTGIVIEVIDSIKERIQLQQEKIEEILDQLKDGNLSEFLVKKENFMSFREVLVKRKDFKNFSGTALRGGDTIYQYLDEPRR